MNIFLVGIIVVVVIVLCTVALKYSSNKVRVIALYILGLLPLGFGLYLLPANSWRSISIGAIVVGVIIEIVAIVITVRCKSISQNKAEKFF